MHICFQKHFWKQPLPNCILHPCSKTTIWNGLKNCLVLAIQTSSMQGVYTEGEEDMIKTKLLKGFFLFCFCWMKKWSFLLFCVAVRSPYLVTSTPYHPPLRQKRSNANVSFHPKALRSKSTPSIARDRWVTAVKSSGTHFRECCDFVVAAIVTSGQYMYVCLVDWCSLLLVTT